MQIYFLSNLAFLLIRLRVHVELDVFSDLGEYGLLYSHELSPEQVNVKAKVCDELHSLLAIELASTIASLLLHIDICVGSFIIDDSQTQDLLILLLNDCLFLHQVLPELVKGLLNILHILFDSADIDHSLGWAMVSLSAHRRARWIKASTAILALEESLLLMSTVWGELCRLRGYELGRL